MAYLTSIPPGPDRTLGLRLASRLTRKPTISDRVAPLILLAGVINHFDHSLSGLLSMAIRVTPTRFEDHDVVCWILPSRPTAPSESPPIPAEAPMDSDTVAPLALPLPPPT